MNMYVIRLSSFGILMRSEHLNLTSVYHIYTCKNKLSSYNYLFLHKFMKIMALDFQFFLQNRFLSVTEFLINKFY